MSGARAYGGGVLREVNGKNTQDGSNERYGHASIFSSNRLCLTCLELTVSVYDSVNIVELTLWAPFT
jgi:hypothetical protein